MRGEGYENHSKASQEVSCPSCSPPPPPCQGLGTSFDKLLRTVTVSDPLVAEGQESPREDAKRIAMVGGLEVWSRVESWTRDEQNGRLGGGREGVWSPEDRLLSRLSGRSDQELTGASIECLVLIERIPQLPATSKYL